MLLRRHYERKASPPADGGGVLEDEYVYIMHNSGGARVSRINKTDSSISAVVASFAVSQERGVCVDHGTGYVYGAARDSGEIFRMKKDGTGFEKLYTGLHSPFGIVEAGGELYWVNQNLSSIQKGSADGTNAAVSIASVSGKLMDVDKENGLLYIAGPGGIRKVPFDGASVTVLLSTYSYQGVALDKSNNRLFFTERTNHTVGVANLDGSAETILTGPRTKVSGLAYSQEEGKIFFGDSGTLYKMNPDGSSITAWGSFPVDRDVAI